MQAPHRKIRGDLYPGGMYPKWIQWARMGARKLTPAMFDILLALAGGEKHGYAIMLEFETLSDGATRLGPATLYRSLKQLVEMDLIEESDERPAPNDDERRRYYRLTASGERIASEEAARLERLVASARRRGLLRGGGLAEVER